MTRDGEIAAIFNPRRARAPSVVVTTGDSPNGPFGSFTNILSTGGGNPQITHSDSLTSSQHDGVDSVVCIQQSGINITSTPTTDTAPPLLGQQQPRKENRCKESCCSELAQKVIISFKLEKEIKMNTLIIYIFIDVFWCMCNHISNSIVGRCYTLYKIFIYTTG